MTNVEKKAMIVRAVRDLGEAELNVMFVAYMAEYGPSDDQFDKAESNLKAAKRSFNEACTAVFGVRSRGVEGI